MVPAGGRDHLRLRAPAGRLVAAYAGPSDTVRLPAQAVADGSPLTVLGWRLLGFQGMALQVVATSSGGDVFVGAADPVDLDRRRSGRASST